MIVIRILSLIFVLTGVVLLIFSFSAFKCRKDFISRASLTHGSVTEVIRRRHSSTVRGSSLAVSHYYKVRYDTDRGQSIEFVNSESHGSPEYKVGEEVPVLYHPDDPSRAAIDSFALLWFNFGLLSVLGVCFLGAGLCNLWITASPARGFRNEVTLRELREAFRQGKLTRGSEYQGLLVAFSFVGFAFFGVAIMVLLFASSTIKFIVAVLMLYTLVQFVRGRRSSRKQGGRA